jgi:solute carrier family 25 protein 14/30
MPHIPHFRRDVESSGCSQTNEKSISASEQNINGTLDVKSSNSNTSAQKARILFPFVYGGVASCVAEVATFPIDTAKIRLQLQGQAIDQRHSTTPYRGMIHCWQKVIAEEGVRVLYNGIAPALLRQAVYGTLKYGIYYSLKGFVISNQIGGEESLTTNVLIAVVAGAVSSAVANPTDVLKVRMQSGKSYVDKESKKAVNQVKTVGAQSISENISNPDRKSRIGLIGAFKDVYQKEGIGGLWRGVSPTAQRASLVAGVQLPAYDLSQQLFIRHNVFKEAYVNNLAASIVAGLCACLASNPFDVIRTRMMDQRKLINVTTANRANKMQNPTKSAKMSNTNSRPKKSVSNQQFE